MTRYLLIALILPMYISHKVIYIPFTIRLLFHSFLSSNDGFVESLSMFSEQPSTPICFEESYSNSSYVESQQSIDVVDNTIVPVVESPHSTDHVHKSNSPIVESQNFTIDAQNTTSLINQRFERIYSTPFSRSKCL